MQSPLHCQAGPEELSRWVPAGVRRTSLPHPRPGEGGKAKSLVNLAESARRKRLFPGCHNLSRTEMSQHMFYSFPGSLINLSRLLCLSLCPPRLQSQLFPSAYSCAQAGNSFPSEIGLRGGGKLSGEDRRVSFGTGLWAWGGQRPAGIFWGFPHLCSEPGKAWSPQNRAPPPSLDRNDFVLSFLEGRHFKGGIGCPRGPAGSGGGDWWWKQPLDLPRVRLWCLIITVLDLPLVRLWCLIITVSVEPRAS